MRRRDFIKVIAVAAANWPLMSRAQGRTARVGVLMVVAETDAESDRLAGAFERGFGAAGWQKGRVTAFSATYKQPNRELAWSSCPPTPWLTESLPDRATRLSRSRSSRSNVAFAGMLIRAGELNLALEVKLTARQRRLPVFQIFARGKNQRTIPWNRHLPK